MCALSAALAGGLREGARRDRARRTAAGHAAPPSRVFAPIDEEPLVSSPVAEAPVPAARAARDAAGPRRTPPPEPEKPHRRRRRRRSVDAPRQLQAVSAPADPEAERRITEMLRNAKGDLSRVDYRGLTRGGREQYDQAKGFTEEAEKALKERNFIYAQTAADKAAKLAAELLGR